MQKFAKGVARVDTPAAGDIVLQGVPVISSSEQSLPDKMNTQKKTKEAQSEVIKMAKKYGMKDDIPDLSKGKVPKDV